VEKKQRPLVIDRADETSVGRAALSRPQRDEERHLKHTMMIGALLFSLNTPAWAADEVNVTTGGTMAGKPLALHGFDPVAYFVGGKPIEGTPQFAAVYEGATYYFSSEANQKAFEAAPSKYAPQFGGFCAFGVALGKKFDGNPQVFLVRDGKLYLNLAPPIAQKFGEDVPGNISKAEANWKKIKSKAAASL
jgi:YHS domain-containing protein